MKSPSDKAKKSPVKIRFKELLKIRKYKDGYEFSYNEGGMYSPDSLNKPSRTIITSEGGDTAYI